MLDDATSEIYYAQLVEQESTRTVLQALREVFEQRGVFCALYSDRASHFFLTPKAGEAVDRERRTQGGRALKELGIQRIAAYSPQARGRSERSFSTWQGRLPQELRLHGITTVDQANRFLRQHYIGECNRRFAVQPIQRGSAFLPCPRRDLDRIFAIQRERVVHRDNTVQVENRCLQIDKTPWRATLAGCRVIRALGRDAQHRLRSPRGGALPRRRRRSSATPTPADTSATPPFGANSSRPTGSFR